MTPLSVGQLISLGIEAGRDRGRVRVQSPKGTAHYRLNLKVAVARLSLFLLLVCGNQACVQTFDHDAIAAGKKAQEFATVAFVRRDFDQGYDLLADATKRYVSLAQFKETVSRLHPDAFPNTVTAEEYEPMKGEKALYVFLIGESPGESFYYRITMSGTADTGYKVLRFDRSREPYVPTADKKPLRGASNINS